jgi:hypothetical protein
MTGVAAEVVRSLLARENERFVAERPRSTELLARAHATMPRGVPMSWMDDLYDQERLAGVGPLIAGD